MPAQMIGGAMLMIAVSLALTVAAGPLYEFTQQAALALSDGTYADVVLEGRR